MTLWKNNGNLGVPQDTPPQRPGFGTIGADHHIPRSVQGRALNAVIDDQDPSVLYGVSSLASVTSISETFTRAQLFDVSGTSTKLSDYGAAAQTYFYGNSLGILARVNPQSSSIRVYIDGTLTAGRTLNFSQLDSTQYSPNSPMGTGTLDYIYVKDHSSFPAFGTVLIDNELFTYDVKDTSGGLQRLHITARGVSNTLVSQHLWNAPVYVWGTTAALTYGSGDINYALNQLVWYNPFLEPGRHKVTIILVDDFGTGNTAMWFDGFVVGSRIGANNVYTFVGTFSISATTDGNGWCSFGTLTSTRPNIQVIGMMGYVQTLPDVRTTSGSTMGKLAWTADADSQPKLIMVNGPVSTSVTVQLVLSYLGETI